MTVHNLMEEIVKQCLRDLIQNQEQLKSLDEKTQGDIMAIALNNLPPKYVSSLQGEMFVKTQVRLQVETDVYRELSIAIEKVSNSSRKTEFTAEA
ncbi:Late competence development protein ComFB [compost metagenome]